MGRKPFSTFDPDSAVVEAWNPSHPNKGGGFRCVRGEFVTYFKQGRLQRDIDAHLGRCWIVQDDSDYRLAGYITLLADKLIVEDPLLEGVQYGSYPAVKIGMLAVDERTHGLGNVLIDWAMEYVAFELSPRIGVRFLTTDALYDLDNGYNAFGFYQKLGFQFADPGAKVSEKEPFKTMYIDLMPLIQFSDSL